ncbi:MAG: CBS domain-containing protein [Nitrososphaeraceae archaeon]|jgi:CBS domain-containing protein
MTSESENIKNVAISEFMTRNVKTITENESVGQACKLMYQENIGSLVIIKKDIVIPVGIVTERDITKMVGLSNKFFADMPVSEIMSQPLITINPLTSVEDAVNLMEQKNIRRLPVTNSEGLIVGIITAKDIFKPLMKIFKRVAKEKDLVSDGFDLLGLIGME